MSLFTGYTDNVAANNGLHMKGNINMDFYKLSKIAAPDDKYDAVSYDWYKRDIIARLSNIAPPTKPNNPISYDWFIRNSRTQTVLYKYLGFTALNQKRVPDYNHGNYRGSDVLHSSNFTSLSKLYVSDIALDADSTDYDIKLKFYARFIYHDNTVIDFDISSGGIELKSRPNFTINFNDINVRWVDLSIVVNLDSITIAGNIRIIIIMVEQIRGVAGGQEFAVHCGVKEY